MTVDQVALAYYLATELEMERSQMIGVSLMPLLPAMMAGRLPLG